VQLWSRSWLLEKAVQTESLLSSQRNCGFGEPAEGGGEGDNANERMNYSREMLLSLDCGLMDMAPCRLVGGYRRFGET
jgi:hypothetical protein